MGSRAIDRYTHSLLHRLYALCAIAHPTEEFYSGGTAKIAGQKLVKTWHLRQIQMGFGGVSAWPRVFLSKLNNPPAKAGGLGLRTESPDTRRLNDAS